MCVEERTSSDSGLYFRRVEQQLLGGGRHGDLLSGPGGLSDSIYYCTASSCGFKA